MDKGMGDELYGIYAYIIAFRIGGGLRVYMIINWIINLNLLSVKLLIWLNVVLPLLSILPAPTAALILLLC